MFKLVLIFIFGLSVGLFVSPKIFSKEKVESGSNRNTVSVREERGVFTNPLLECEQAEDVFTELKPFKSEIEKIIEEEKRKNNLDYAAVYFRDLNNGPWVGINERETFSPASLLKLPVVMAYYKMAEKDPGLLQKTFTFLSDEHNPPLVQAIKPGQTLEVGMSYTVEDLLYRAIVYSDNRAHYLLTDNLNEDIIIKTFSDFGLAYPTKPEEDVLVNVKNYAGFFRVLFNASYLNRESSEKVLELLSKVEYKEGLVGGLPQNILVAHKFGERTDFGNAPKQLHDCGIVYYEKHPYLLCIMTRGESVDRLNSSIKNISKAIYEEINIQHRKHLETGSH